MERNYQFRERMLQVHPSGLRDDRIWKAETGTVIDDSWQILYPQDCAQVIRTAALDLQEFFHISMECYPHLRAVPDINTVPEKAIILTDAAHSPALAPEDPQPAAYRLQVTGSAVIICGVTGRGTAQGVYYAERRMGIHRGPVLTPGQWCRRPLFSPRMTHSGYCLDEFPDGHINAIAHAGMDTLLVFVKELHISSHGYMDLNDLIRRAAAYGVDVYAYSYYKSTKHPDEPDARAFYESTYGRLFENCPGLKGVVLVGESVEFPSKDPHTSGKIYSDPTDPRPRPGWYPCEDYPQWVAMVRDIIREKNPQADFVFWTYNWGYVEAEPRIALINALPTDISLNVTYEMFETVEIAPGLSARCADYTLMFEGPGQYFVSEAQAAHARGIPLYAMSNTGGVTWDIGDIPYQPAPYQWKRRYDSLIKAHHEWGLCGLMESHHYGFYPSFVSELANCAYWAPAEDYDTAMWEIAGRDFGRGNEAQVLSAWKDFSDGSRCYVCSNPDQYSVFRIGPSYPLLFRQDATIPSESFALRGGNHICFPMYSYYIDRLDRLPLEIESLERMYGFYDAGCQKLEQLLPGLSGYQLDQAQRQAALGRFIANSARTAINVKKWYLCKCRLLEPDKDILVWKHDHLPAPDFRLDWTAPTAEEAIRIITEMRAIAEDELENARRTIPAVELDSRLGFEPTMEYMCDRAHLEWKIEKTEQALAELEPLYRAAQQTL